jgi:hypothetical protein
MTDLHVVYKEIYEQVIQENKEKCNESEKREQKVNFLNEEKQSEVEPNGNTNQIMQLEG